MPRNARPSPPRARHSRTQIIAARERKTEQRFRRLKNEPFRGHWYGSGLRDPDFTVRWWWKSVPAMAAIAELIAAVDSEAPIVALTPELIRELTAETRRELFIGWPIRLEQLCDRIYYRDCKRDDPWDFPEVGECAQDGRRSRETAAWRDEISQDIRDWEQGDPNGDLLAAGEVFERDLAELLADPAARTAFELAYERALAAAS